MTVARASLPTLLLASLLAGCGSAAPTPSDLTPIGTGQVLAVDATIRLMPFEHACWAIETAPGRRFEPVNLGTSFRRQGLAVHVVLHDAVGITSTCMFGPAVTVDSIVTQ